MESVDLKNPHVAELISSISSEKIREIILYSASSQDSGWGGVCNAMCGLVGEHQGMNVTLRVFLGSYPGEYPKICMSFRKMLPENFRLVLVEEPMEGEGEAVVLHDSWIPGGHLATRFSRMAIGSTK